MESITIKDCGLFLIGNEEAIRKLAKSKSSLYLGAFFVLIAGIAREYDQEYIPLNGVLFLVPFIASFVMCSILYIFSLPYYRKKVNPNGLGGFRTYLSIFWLTGPLAWFYAFPAEALFEPLTALKINLSLLGIVAFWRVWLFTRAMKVLTEVNLLPLILTVACPVIFFVSFFQQFSIVGVMSGGAKTEAQDFLMDVSAMVTLLSMITFVPSVIIACIDSSKISDYTSFEKNEKIISSRNLKIFNLALLTFFIIILIPAQQKLSKHFKVVDLIDDGQIAEAIDYANTLSREDLPPAVKLYPTIRYYGFQKAIKVFSQMDGSEAEWFQNDIKTWVRLGIETRHYRNRDKLIDCTLNEYQINFFKLHKDAVTKFIRTNNKEHLEKLEPLIKALDITFENSGS